MIVRKAITCTVKDLDEVVLTIAEEVKKGWTVHKIEPPQTIEISYHRDYWPEFVVHLERKVPRP